MNPRIREGFRRGLAAVATATYIFMCASQPIGTKPGSSMLGANRVAPMPLKTLPSSAAAAKVASERGRIGAQKYRSAPGSVDSLRAKVKAEMRRESQESKALAQKKIDLMDAERAKEQEEADALREEARATFAQAMIEEHAAVASQQLTEDAAAGHGPVDTTDETVDKPADEELSHVERITQILKERSERRRQDAATTDLLLQRAACRRLDADRFGGAITATSTTSMPHAVAALSSAASAVRIADRSLFQWAPPALAAPSSSTAAAAAAAAPSGSLASAAARDAWAWLERPAANLAVPCVPEADAA